jgi:uroporphyrin-III C-methyltransferase
MSNDDQKTEISEINSDAIVDNEGSNGPDGLNSSAPAEQNEKSGGGALGGIIAALIALGLVAFGGYYWHQNYYLADREALEAKVNSVSEGQNSMQTALAAVSVDAGPDASIEALKAAQKKIETSLTSKVDLVAKQTKEVADSQQKLQQSVTSLYQKEDQSSLDWVLAEAEYLVLAANQRLALEGDINTAIAALKAADQRLGSENHPDLIPIRDQIIEDAAALEAVKLPDIEGLAIYLAKVIEQAKDLPTKKLADSVEPFSGTKNLADDAKQWRNVANAVWTDLVELVEVKDAALPDSVLFDPELKYFLQQNLRLELASARLSVLRRDGQNFRASVGLIKNMLNEFYETSATSVESIIARLDEAESYEFEPALPKITGSLDVIRAHLKSKPTARAAK